MAEPRNPSPAYPPNAKIYGDKELYARIGKIVTSEGGKELVEKFEVPIRSGKAWVVKKGMFSHTSRIRNGEWDQNRCLRSAIVDVFIVESQQVLAHLLLLPFSNGSWIFIFGSKE